MEGILQAKKAEIWIWKGFGSGISLGSGQIVVIFSLPDFAQKFHLVGRPEFFKIML